MTEKTVHRLIWVWNFDKEERWLEEMSRQGWALDRVSFLTYHFTACAPGAYTIRLQMLEGGVLAPRRGEYIRFVESTGAEYIGCMGQWGYFRKKTEDGPFELFSDLDSRLHHIDRVLRMLALVGIANLLVGLMNLRQLDGIGWVNLVLAAVVAYGCWRIWKKRDKLAQDRTLHE